MRKIFRLTLIGLLISSLLFNVSASKTESQNSFEKSNVYRISTYAGSRSYGTGFSIDINGVNYVITNNHVCSVSDKSVLWAHNEYGDTWHRLDIVTRDGEHDLCLLSSPTVTSGLKLGEKGGWLKDTIRVMGHPGMRPLTESRGKITEISEAGVQGHADTEAACNKPWMKWVSQHTFFGMQSACFEIRESYIVDALVIPGSSGSPVFNEAGLVIGIIYAAGPGEGLYIGVEHINTLIKNLDAEKASCKTVGE